ncbi:hypothetical protein F4802DRAFT_573919 [Xylaria palmicola]|nr:hypothetical protein F4802DRAFT_573919 [Xylaria palmicola]
MGKTFGTANNTIIYLGPQNLYIDVIIDLVKRRAHSDNLGFTVTLPWDDGSPGDQVPIVSAVDKGLLAHPWFRRIWVLQELVLSREPWVQCGTERVRWWDLCRLLIPLINRGRFLPSLEIQQQTPLERMNSIRTRYYKVINPSSERAGRTLWYILSSREGCRVSDARDIIFAHMGIISDRDVVEKFVKTDYSQTASEVLVAAGHYAWHDCRDYELATGFTSSPLRKMIGLPSWVPDWGVYLDPPYFHPEISTVTWTRTLDLTLDHLAEITHCSGILPILLSQEMLELIHSDEPRSRRAWSTLLSNLPARTTDEALGTVGLSSWPDEIGRLSPTREPHALETLLRCLRLSVSSTRLLRLALLHNGDVMLASLKALPGDIVATADLCPRNHHGPSPRRRSLIVRPCEPRNVPDSSDAPKYAKDKLDEYQTRHGSFIDIVQDEELPPYLGRRDLRSRLSQSPHKTLFVLY